MCNCLTFFEIIMSDITKYYIIMAFYFKKGKQFLNLLARFGVFYSTRECFNNMGNLPLPMKGCKDCPILGTHSLLRHGPCFINIINPFKFCDFYFWPNSSCSDFTFIRLPNTRVLRRELFHTMSSELSVGPMSHLRWNVSWMCFWLHRSNMW